jgi:type II secretory pathway component GspD/PulD (secretin)
MHFTRVCLLPPLLALLIGAPVAGQSALEVIPLRHRTVEQVLPALRPLMEPGATLTGQGTQLIVRASPANVAELRRALEAIDRPAKRLQISVRLDEAADRASQSVDVSGTISNRDARVDVSAAARESSAQGRVDQRIQVLDGGRAYIFTGQETPYRDTATGFEAVPRVAGQMVQVDILQQRQTSARQQGLATTVSARLGEWFEVGHVVEQASTSTSRGAQSRRVWLKVEELRP